MIRRTFVRFLRGSIYYPLFKYIYCFYNQIGSKRLFSKLEKNSSLIKLNLGSGPIKGSNGWTTIDQYDCDICWDLRKGIPLCEDSVHSIYSSHLLEHLDYKSLIKFIEHCRRILKKGGTMSVCVPDANKYIDAYVRKSKFRPISSLYSPAIVDTGSHLDQVNYIAYLDEEHKYLFDQENLINIFIKCGFSTVKERKFDPDLDRIERDFHSIYCIATK